MAATGDGGTPKPALISVRQTTPESKWAGATCPKCSQPIEAGQSAVLCPKCYTPHHLDCWNANDKKCAVDGTPANVIDRTAQRAAAPTAETPQTAAPAAAPSVPAANVAPPPALASAGAQAQPAAATAVAPTTAVAAAATQTQATPAQARPAARPAAARPAAAAPPAAAAAGGGAASRTAMRSAARRAQTQLTVWPHLLMPEFLSAVLLLIGLTLMSWFINAPLEEHSNPNRTPNPSKAPWYFLNLQELLLHMHPGLAGVIIPTIVLILLMAIPYLDITTDDTGVWFSGERGKKVFWISTIYTSVMTIFLIMLDKYVGVRAVIENAIPLLRTSFISEIVTQTIVPTLIMWVVSVILYLLIAHLKPTVRDVMIAYFTAFAVSWVLMAIIGAAFRGPAQELFWPWAMPPRVG